MSGNMPRTTSGSNSGCSRRNSAEPASVMVQDAPRPLLILPHTVSDRAPVSQTNDTALRHPTPILVKNKSLFFQWSEKNDQVGSRRCHSGPTEKQVNVGRRLPQSTY